MNPTRKEKYLYEPILRLLNYMPNTMAWLTYNSGVYGLKSGRYYRKSGQVDGVADIIGLKKGVPFAFEVKREGQIKNVSAAQRQWLERFSECGGKAFVIDNLEDVEKCWKEI